MFILLLLFIASAFGDATNYPIQIPSTILDSSKAYLSKPFRVNLKEGSLVTMYHQKAVQFCFNRHSLDGISPVFWNISCNFYFSFAALNQPGSDTKTIYLRDATYYMGISLVDLSTNETDTFEFILGRKGDDCPFDQAYDIPTLSCVVPTATITVNETANVTLAADHSAYFKFVIPQNGIGQVTAYSPNTDGHSLILLFRLWGTPSSNNDLHDGTASSSAILDYPRPGTYILKVRATNNVTNAIIALKMDTCHSKNMTGPNCTIYYNESISDVNIVSVGGKYRYWALPVPANSQASVSVAPDEGDFWNYQVFASLGQLPQLKNTDLSNCYGSSCLAAWTINITSGPADEIWYIAVLPAFNNKTYSIWFNSVCHPQCINHGLCTTDGNFIGKCACSADYSGSACQISNALSAQYIVLIIIACLLFTSAIVGLIAQAYMKRKGYQGYQNI